MTASLPMTSPHQAQPGRPGPGLGISIGLMVAGAMVVIASVIAIAVPLVNTFTSRTYAAPTHLSLHLRHARYTVFERTGSSSGLNFGTRSGRITIDPSQVTVTAPDGEPVPVFPAENRETMKRGSDDYTSAVEFDTPMSGNYDVRVTTRVATSVIITRSPEEAIRSVLVWFGTGAVGGIILVGGLVMLIVGVTRRGRARRAAQVGWGQPGWGQPGWGQAQYPPAPYPPPPQYPLPQYPPPQYPPPQYPPPQYPPPPPQDPPPPANDPSDPWAPR
jgi:hypothetical protein